MATARPKRIPSAPTHVKTQSPDQFAWINWLAPVIILVAVIAAFAPAFSAEFVSWDDYDAITRNPSFRGFSPTHLKWMFTTTHMGHYQPLSWLSLAVNYEIGKRFLRGGG